CHLGTFVTNPNAYRVAAQKLAEFARQIEALARYEMSFVNLGGGIPSNNAPPGYEAIPQPWLSEFADALCDPFRAAFGKREAMPELILECGRALVDSAASLIATVVGTRRMASGERGLVLDAGLNVLYTAHWYAHSVYPAQPTPGAIENTTLHGPLCMNIDT